MPKMRLGIAVLLSILAASHSLAKVANPGFELGTGTVPTRWTKFGNVYREPINARSGTQSLKMFGNFTGGTNDSGAYQSIPIKTGQTLSASVYAMTPTNDAMVGNNQAYMRLVYRNAANQTIASAESRRLSSSTPRSQFQLISASLGAAPANAVRAEMYLLFTQPSSTPFAGGAVFFDDVNVTIQNSARPTTLVWSDEFNGTSLNPTNWEALVGTGTAYGLPAGWGNNELQYYRTQNATVSGGLLRITAKRESIGGRSYTSARIRTLGKRDFKYGRIEARIKTVSGQGIWPAFWMLPTQSPYGGWASSGEIDVMETINSADRVFGTIHHGGPWPANVQTGGNKVVSGLTNDFQVYSIQWDPDKITWYLNDQEYFSVSSQTWYSTVAPWNQRAPFDSPFHIILNVAVGGDWPGNPDGATPFPREMQVDWVRVYQHKATAEVKPGPLPIFERVPW